MTTRVPLDRDLVNAAKRVGKHGTNKEAVAAAWKEYVRRQGQLQILELRSKVNYHADYDHKKLHRLR